MRIINVSAMASHAAVEVLSGVSSTSPTKSKCQKEMRALGGSIIVTAVSRSVWNALAYMFFGEGPKIGALGVTQTLVYAPEVGFVGLILNIAFLVVLLAFARAGRPLWR